MFPLSLHCHGNSLLLCYHTRLLQLFALPVVASCHGCSCGHCVTVVVHSCNSCMAMVDCSPNHCMATVNSLPSRSLHCHGHLLLWSLLALLVPMFTLAVFILLQSFVLTVMRCHSLFALAVIALLQLLALVIIALLWSFALTITTLPQSFSLTIITLCCRSHLLAWLLQSFCWFTLCWHHFGAREALEHLLIVWLLIVSHQILEMIIILSWMMSLVIHCQSLSIKSQKEVEQMFLVVLYTITYTDFLHYWNMVYYQLHMILPFMRGQAQHLAMASQKCEKLSDCHWELSWAAPWFIILTMHGIKNFFTTQAISCGRQMFYTYERGKVYKFLELKD